MDPYPSGDNGVDMYGDRNTPDTGHTSRPSFLLARRGSLPSSQRGNSKSNERYKRKYNVLKADAEKAIGQHENIISAQNNLQTKTTKKIHTLLTPTLNWLYITAALSILLCLGGIGFGIAALKGSAVLTGLSLADTIDLAGVLVVLCMIIFVASVKRACSLINDISKTVDAMIANDEIAALQADSKQMTTAKLKSTLDNEHKEHAQTLRYRDEDMDDSEGYRQDRVQPRSAARTYRMQHRDGNDSIHFPGLIDQEEQRLGDVNASEVIENYSLSGLTVLPPPSSSSSEHSSTPSSMSPSPFPGGKED